MNEGNRNVSAGEEFEKLLSTMEHLRGPNGCPWDSEQTMRSLRPYILEEAYELVEAIAGGQTGEIREEVGDLLLEVVFVAQIARENGLFTMTDATRDIADKLIRRHPHVFKESSADDADEALEHWETIKAREKPSRESLLDGVGRTLPALARATKLGKRAARGGFDWPSIAGVQDKVDEELRELTDAIESDDHAAIHEEVGDLLFAMTNLARFVGVDAELALIDANEKFSKRFRFMEKRLAGRGSSVESSTMDELSALWDEAKEDI